MSETPAWLKAGLMITGLLALFSFISIQQNPTVRGDTRRRRRVDGVRVLENEDDLALWNLELGWHWFARKYPDGRYSKPWHTTRNAARRGMFSAPAWSELWGYDEKTKRWVQDRFSSAKYR